MQGWGGGVFGELGVFGIELQWSEVLFPRCRLVMICMILQFFLSDKNAPWIPRLGKDLMPSLVTRNEHLGDRIILTCDRKLSFSHIRHYLSRW